MDLQESKRQSILQMLQSDKTTSDIRKALNCSRTAIFGVRKLFHETRDIKRRFNKPKPVKQSPQLLRSVKRKVKRILLRSIRQLAREANVANSTMQTVMKDLNLKSRVVVTKHLITNKQKESRKERCKKMLNWRKSYPGPVTIFSDEKLFTVDKVTNHRNTRYLSCTIVTQGTLDEFIHLLQEKVISWLNRNYPDGQYVFQQDGAPAHTSKKIQNFLSEKMS
ncbi:uncharacterized protein LOC124812490 [Hydra vulgaris]|uniref:uncharacterized protein LOC124812490 n=1 Tax=Hydra vulgaris TaxID=6087 RepID=UPI001F5F3BDC|nr:uncharacterized protein LOC124812490 [Hydra vulgaris]